MIGAISFVAPLALSALLAVPLLWWLLKLTPPRPRRIAFPPLVIAADLMIQRKTAAKTPWWILLLRVATLVSLIIALAGPLWRKGYVSVQDPTQPLIVVLDNGVFSAPVWDRLQSAAQGILEQAVREDRHVAIIATLSEQKDISFGPARVALETLHAFTPQAALPDRCEALSRINDLLDVQSKSEILWISDGMSGSAAATCDTGMMALAIRTSLSIRYILHPDTTAIQQVANLEQGMDITLVRPEALAETTATLLASDDKGHLLTRTVVRFDQGVKTAHALIDVPLEVRNSISRLHLEGVRSAAGVYLLDDTSMRQRVGVINGGNAEIAQPLIASTYYIKKALSPLADVTESRGSVAEGIENQLSAGASVLILTDVGMIDAQATRQLEAFMDKGGVVIRFSGPRLSEAREPFAPVRLRQGGRSFGGALSWDQPRSLAPFPAGSPLADLAAPSDVNVTRQLMAEPDPALNSKTWAHLDDGTPVITGERHGRGALILFHVTADPSWSNLPLSGSFVTILGKLIGLANFPGLALPKDGNATSPAIERTSLAPLRLLDGFGAFLSPPATVQPLNRVSDIRASAAHPAGFYGIPERQRALNVLSGQDNLSPLVFSSAVKAMPLDDMTSQNLRTIFLIMALGLFVIDTVIMMVLNRSALRQSSGAAAVIGCVMAIFFTGTPPAHAQNQPFNPNRGPAFRLLSAPEVKQTLRFRLAYIITGDADVDATSAAGLLGLSQTLSQRTAVEPVNPVGLDPSQDELAFYPLIYWPITVQRPPPSSAAIRRIDSYMKNGGTVIFDTRDAASVRYSDAPTPAALYLRLMLAGLDIPPLEPVPTDHVLMRAFYLLTDLPGRYATGRTWTEVLPVAEDGLTRRPARAGDGISPIIITSNDWAAAWAVGSQGEPRHAMVGGGERQREMSLRAGINLVMYALTGNYKADQVHVAPLLERLGQ